MNTELPLLEIDDIPSSSTILINEVYGLVQQGEGPLTGHPCYFLRTQGCPVKCESCDSAMTWDKTEKGHRYTYEELFAWFVEKEPMLATGAKSKVGVVLTGGEPLLHHSNEPFRLFLKKLKRHFAWISLETSGVSPIKDKSKFLHFLLLFNSISVSPKITNCLSGPLERDKLVENIETLLEFAVMIPNEESSFFFKFVVRDQEDYTLVQQFDEEYGVTKLKIPIFLMPYGMTKEEIMENFDSTLAFAGQAGYRIANRVHVLMYGNVRRT